MLRLRSTVNGVRFEDVCKIAEELGFRRKGGLGSHRTYAREDEPLLLNFQNCNGSVKPYQVRQMLNMVEKYGKQQDPVQRKWIEGFRGHPAPGQKSKVGVWPLYPSYLATHPRLTPSPDR